jgi:hypothetical protein
LQQRLAVEPIYHNHHQQPSAKHHYIPSHKHHTSASSKLLSYPPKIMKATTTIIAPIILSLPLATCFVAEMFSEGDCGGDSLGEINVWDSSCGKNEQFSPPSIYAPTRIPQRDSPFSLAPLFPLQNPHSLTLLTSLTQNLFREKTAYVNPGFRSFRLKANSGASQQGTVYGNQACAAPHVWQGCMGGVNAIHVGDCVTMSGEGHALSSYWSPAPCPN